MYYCLMGPTRSCTDRHVAHSTTLIKTDLIVLARTEREIEGETTGLIKNVNEKKNGRRLHRKCNLGVLVAKIRSFLEVSTKI